MAARTPPHVSLAYPEETVDEGLLVERTERVTSETPAFGVTVGESMTESEQGAVWFSVLDPTGTWTRLRKVILAPPFHPLPLTPHVTVVHPRTSDRGAEAFAELGGTRIEKEILLGEVAFTETDRSGMRILERFPLAASRSVRVVAGVLRRAGQVLLCHRRPDRMSYPNVWDLPGGHIDERESTADTLVRELEEELGIAVEAPTAPPWVTLNADGVELHLYLVDRWKGEPRNAALDEHDDIRWTRADELAHLDLAHRSYSSLLRRALT